MRSCLYRCRLVHARRFPQTHRFMYALWYFYLDLDELPLLSRRLRLLGVERPSLYSFYSRDHLDGVAPIAERLHKFLRAQGVAECDSRRVALLTLCRQWGYVFNPVSFYFCTSDTSELRALVAEVNNTFGERYSYLLAGDELQRRGPFWFAAATKVMHVSPFAQRDGALYRFRWRVPDERLLMCIREVENGVTKVDTALWGERVPLTDLALLRAALKRPWQTMKVTAAIHWEALRLYRKGLPFFSQPPPSQDQRSQAELWAKL